jgi:MFS transporter, OFA family, oxalate/formate antiporter
MKGYLTVAASFVIMLCLGGVYAWSIVAAELINSYNFTSSQTQIIFGTLLAFFPITMIFAEKLSRFLCVRYIASLSALLLFSGYLLAAFSKGNFLLLLLGIGVLSGIATGFGYWVSLTIPVQWFPERKGLIAGIAVAGFGLGAILLSAIIERLLLSGRDILEALFIIGTAYGLLIFMVSNFLSKKKTGKANEELRLANFLLSKVFAVLFSGIFLGTFSGLLIIGSLKMIGREYNIGNEALLLGISVFAIANFLGRLSWGFLSDHLSASLTIFMALLMQAIGIFLLDLTRSDSTFIILSFVIGMGFGGNFVLFAKETVQAFGLAKLGIIYPYVFLGYALAGIAGPTSGGMLFDLTGSFRSAIFLSGTVSLFGAFLYLIYYFNSKKERYESAG